MKTKVIVPVAILVAGAVIATAVYITTTKHTQTTTRENPSAMLPVGPTDHILSSPNAPVKIIEYSDFSCQYCAKLQRTLRRIINDYGPTGKVALVFREFPLTEIHPNAMTYAQAAECVAKTAGNAAFWNFADVLFSNQPLSPTHIGQYAREAGADPASVSACIASGSVDAHIMLERKNALSIGANGAPYALITVYGAPEAVIDGSYPYQYIQDQINTALSLARSSTAQ